MIHVKKLDKKGFTIIELMIATVIFSFILLLTSAGVIAIGQNYYKSLTSTRIQETARSIMEDVSRSMQFSGTTAIQGDNDADNNGVPDAIGVRCFGSDRYTYAIDQEVIGTSNGLYRDTMPSEGCIPSTCFNNAAPACAGEELLGDNMRLLVFDVTPPTIQIKVAYGDDNLLSHYDPNTGALISTDFANVNCHVVSGRNFCAVAELETSVTSRVK